MVLSPPHLTPLTIDLQNEEDYFLGREEGQGKKVRNQGYEAG